MAGWHRRSACVSPLMPQASDHRSALLAAATRLGGGQSARRHLLFPVVRALGMAARILSRGPAGIACLIRAVQREGIGSLERIAATQLVRLGPRYRLTLEAVHLYHAAH